ncbi:MAG TPA: hypothetical protein VFC79_09960, partial [Tissierellaceae bacterium]|nr:hypothetical protein [Tissierellaceae bacterium]
MAYNTKEILKDKDLNPISQYYNPTADKYEAVEGANGGNKVVVENNDLSLLPILDKLSQLTGTVIDENTRKTNEIDRKDNELIRVDNESDRISKETIRVSNEDDRIDSENIRISSEDDRIINEGNRISAEVIRNASEEDRVLLYNLVSQKLDDGEFVGKGLEYVWDGTQLGVRIEGQPTYVYVNLKGEKGDTGNIENLTAQHVIDALGYTPPQQDTTYTEIATAEIDEGTSATLRTITARRLKYAIDKVPTTPVIDNLTSTSTTDALSANMGRELFQSVSNGKILIATAITDKGGVADGSDTFNELAAEIGNISSESVLVAGDMVAFSDDAEVKASNTNSKVKEVEIRRGGSVRVSYALRGQTTGVEGVGQIYKNGIAVGEQRTVLGTTEVTFVEDFNIDPY